MSKIFAIAASRKPAIFAFAFLAAMLLPSNQALSQTKSVAFQGGGTTTFDGWDNLNFLRLSSSQYGTWPGDKDWSQPINANIAGSAGGSITRLAKSPNGGGPFPSDASLYFGSSKVPIVPNTLGGTLAVSRSAVTGVRSVAFQIELGEGQPQGQTRYFFHEPVGNPTAGRPTLYVNGQPIDSPTHTALVNQRSTIDGGGQSGEDPVFVNTYGYQWNISTTNVTSLEVRFSCVEHASIYSMRLDQTSILQTNNVFTTNQSSRIIGLSGNFAFGNVTVGQTTNRTLTISNSGNSTLSVTNITYPQGFRGSWSNGIIALAANSATNIIVTFAPTNAQSFGGDVRVASDATSGLNTIGASGTGIAPPTRVVNLTGNLNFGNLTVGQTTNRTLTISNSGNSTLSVTNISYPQGFRGSWSNGIIALAANSATNITVTFAPTNAQSFGGDVRVASDATSGLNTIGASGTGIAAPTRIIGMPASLDFGNSPVGGTRMLTLTISNTGNAQLNVTGISYPPGFSGETNSSSISSAGSRSINITFSPNAEGIFNGTIKVGSDANGGSGDVSVMGRGIAPAIRQVLSGTPQFNGTATTVTNNFQSTPDTWLNIEFTDNLGDSNSWTPHSEPVYSQSGEFRVIFTKPGDHRTTWQRGMFFRLSYPTKP